VNASVYFYNYSPGFTPVGWSNGKYQVVNVHSGGAYSLSGCPCQDLTAYLYVPSGVMGSSNGGQDCWIIMANKGNYSGLPASPGDVINWQALDMPCSSTWYASDQSAVQSEATAVLPSLNSGSWQTAEQIANGAGSGG
jgi:hypothetical protein